MLKAELAFAKSGALSTNDWDTYQAILRKCLSFKKPQQKQAQKQSAPAQPTVLLSSATDSTSTV